MRLYRITSLWKWTRKNDNVEKERVVMEQIELVKILLKNSYINFLLGAGTSYNKVEGRMNFPLMGDLLNFIKEDVKVLEFYNSLRHI